MWTRTRNGNEVLGDKANGFYVSYRSSISQHRLDNPLFDVLSSVGEMFGGIKTAEEETALYTVTEPNWRILNGDYRNAYAQAFPKGVDACIAIYNKYKAEARSDWSDDDVDTR